MPIGAILGALGAGLGGIGQAAGGFLSASASRKAASQNRELLARFQREAVERQTLATREEQEQALLAQRRAARKELQAQAQARSRTEAELRDTFASPQYQAAGRYVAGAFAQGIPDVLAETYQGRLRQAQAARGLEQGGAPTQQEASLLTGLAEQGRRALLPQLRQMALDPLQLRQQSIMGQLGIQGGAQNIGLAQLQAQLRARSSAQGVAQARVGQLNNLGFQTAQTSPFSAASPLANLLFGVGGALGTAGGALLGGAGGGGGGTLQPRPDFELPSPSSFQFSDQFAFGG
jgi:hypothetical protein